MITLGSNNTFLFSNSYSYKLVSDADLKETAVPSITPITKSFFKIVGAISLPLFLAPQCINQEYNIVNYSENLIKSETISSDDNIGGMIVSNVSNETFDQFEKRIEDKIDTISNDLISIKNTMTTLATNSDLSNVEKSLQQEIKANNSKITNMIMGGVIAVLLGLLGYLFFNPGIAINIFKAISGQ